MIDNLKEFSKISISGDRKNKITFFKNEPMALHHRKNINN